ncbi:TRAP transporter large permease subunit [Chloroflexota bacterium]
MSLDPVMVGLVGMCVLLALLAIGVPVGITMLLVGFVGFAVLVTPEAALSKLAISPFTTISRSEFAVLPLFMLMATMINATGFVKTLFDFAYKMLGHMRGGLVVATIAACAMFAAISASSIATAVTIGMIAIPEMRRYKYDDALATGAVAAGGSMGVLIPPSGLLILYGIITETSIARLFMAGIIPGILEAVFYIIAVSIICRINPKLGPPGPKFSNKERLKALGQTSEVFILIILVLGGAFHRLVFPYRSRGCRRLRGYRHRPGEKAV